MKNKFITLKEFLISEKDENITNTDSILLTKILLESISSEDFTKALAKLSSLNFSSNTIDIINEDRGRLKRLVGKNPEAYLDSGDTMKIGIMIANMDGTNRRDYMGIINFLGASCRIHHELKEAYIDEVRSQRQENREPHLSEDDIASIERAEALGKKEDDEKERKRAQKESEQQKGVGQPQAQEYTQMGRS